MLVQEILYDVRALIDEYTEEGVVVAADDVATIEANGIRFINMAVQEIYSNSDTFKEHKIVNKRIPNLLGDLSQFDVDLFVGDDMHYPKNLGGVVGAKAYFFTLDSDATVLIREYNGASWSTLETLTITTDTETDYKGLISPSNASYPIELVFSGTTFYKHLNRCLYSYPFKASAIPDFKAWVRYDMPSDYGELDSIVTEYPERQYQVDGTFKWEGFKTLAVNYFYDGTLKVIYKPVPATITLATDEIDINNPVALQFVRFFTAAKIATTENNDLVNFFEQKSNELKYEALKSRPSGETRIQDVYFGGV